jgi:hypothetical protein
VSEKGGVVMGFARLTHFTIAGGVFGCILFVCCLSRFSP